jgi:c-di-GMP-binding flagellar brake protein YcgR
VQIVTSTRDKRAKRTIGAERREHRRVPYETRVSAEPVPQGLMSRHCPLLAEDLSEGGLRASATDFVPIGSRLLVTLDREEPKQAIRAVGTVVWVRQLGTLERWSLGLSFDDLSPATQAQVRELLQGPIP